MVSNLTKAVALPLFTLLCLIMSTSACQNSSTGSGSDADETKDRTSIGVVPFSQDTVLEYHITIDPEVLEDLEQYGNDKIYRPVSLQIIGDDVDKEYTQVGFRYKGGYSIYHCWFNNGGVRNFEDECAKISTKIKFNEYDDTGRFYGLKRINLNALSWDASKLRDRLAYSLFNNFGVDAPRVAHAKLYINDRPPVLVLAVEQIDGRYTAYHYQNGGDGNLYKDIWPKPDLEEENILYHLKTNNNTEDNPDVSNFIAFGNAVYASTEETFRADMNGLVDLDQLYRYMAVDRALRNWDGITAFYIPSTPYNFYWYHDLGDSNLFYLVPWDFDNALWEFDPYMHPEDGWTTADPIPDWNVKPASCEKMSVWDPTEEPEITPPGCDQLINYLAATGWDEFAAIGNELLNTHFSFNDMNEKITAWEEQISTMVDEDPNLILSEWETEVEDLRSIIYDAIDDFEQHLSEGYIVY